MASIYLLYGLLPVWILHSINRPCKKKSDVYMDKSDTNNLRGIASCFVIAAHFCAWIDEAAGGVNRIFYACVSQLGGVGVLIFFFVSGYGIHSSYAQKNFIGWDFMKKRLKSVYFPYVLMKILFLFATSVINGEMTFGILEFVSILLVEDWFIHVILVQYISFFIAKKWGKIDKIILFSFLSNVVVSAIFLLEGRPERWFNALWLFTFGMFCNKHAEKIALLFVRKGWIKIIVIFVLFCVLGILFAMNKNAFWANAAKPLSGVLLCLGIYGVLQEVTISSLIWNYLGKRSMYIYIVHLNMWFLLGGIKNVVFRFWGALIFSLIISEIMYRLTRIELNQKIMKLGLRHE